MHDAQRAKCAEPSLTGSHAQTGPVGNIADMPGAGLLDDSFHVCAVHQLTFADNIFISARRLLRG